MKETMELEFIHSWDAVEKSYAEFSPGKRDALLELILGLIRQMRSKGFDKTLRAGTSLYSLGLPRSGIYGLRPDQKNMRFDFVFIQNRTMDVTDKNGVKYSFDKIGYNESIEAMLRELEREEID